IEKLDGKVCFQSINTSLNEKTAILVGILLEKFCRMLSRLLSVFVRILPKSINVGRGEIIVKDKMETYWVQLVDKASTASDLSDLTRSRLRGCIGKYGLRYKVEGGVLTEHRYNRKNLAPSLESEA
ncbi:hypothetical protein, partial [Vibrio campbellii]